MKKLIGALRGHRRIALGVALTGIAIVAIAMYALGVPIRPWLGEGDAPPPARDRAALPARSVGAADPGEQGVLDAFAAGEERVSIAPPPTGGL